MTLLSYTNRTLYSASVHNNWLRSAAKDYKLASANRACFNGSAKDYGADTYYLYYTGDTNTVHYVISGGPVTFTINGVLYSPSTGDGTFTVSGLTANTVYEVTVDRSGDSYAKVLWLAFQVSITSTSPPTFTDATIPTAANFSDMYSSLAEAEIAQDILSLPHAFSWLDTLPDYRDVWHGGFIAGQDTLTFNATINGLDSGSMDIEAFVAGSSVWGAINYTTNQTIEIDIDLSALSLTSGDVTELQIRAKHNASDSSRLHLNWMYTHDDTTLPSPTAEFSRGDTVAAAGLNFMTNALVYAHPISGTTPMIRELPAMRSVNLDDSINTDFYRIKHTFQFLRYEAFAGSETPQIIYNGGNIDLSTDTGTQVYDLTNLSDLAMGELYQVTNCKFAIEDVTDA